MAEPHLSIIPGSYLKNVSCDAVKNQSPDAGCLNGNCDSSADKDSPTGKRSGADFGANENNSENEGDGAPNNGEIGPTGGNDLPGGEPDDGSNENIPVPTQTPTPVPIDRGTDNEINIGGGSGSGDVPLDPIALEAEDRRILFEQLEYKTSPESPFAPSLYRIAKSLLELNAYVQLQTKNEAQRQAYGEFRDLAYSSLGLADDNYAKSNISDANSYLYFAASMVEAAYDMATSEVGLEVLTFTGPGEVLRNVYELSTQSSLITGEPLSREEMGLAFLGLATGGLGSKIFKTASKLNKIAGTGAFLKNIFKRADKFNELDKIVNDAKVIDQVLVEAHVPLKGAADKLHFDSNGQPKWPPNMGFEGLVEFKTLEPGIIFDRYGDASGKYVADLGTPFGQRSLPETYRQFTYNKYKVLKPIEVQAGKSSPWFGFEGGGVQYLLEKPIQQLLDDNIIQIIK